MRRNVSTTLVSSSSEKGVMASAGFNLATRHMLKQGTPALAELLVSHGASIAAKDDDGLNALYHAY